MIYFLQSEDGGHIKIGTTIRLTERLKQLSKETGTRLRVLAITDGGYDTEGELHARFGHLRVADEREWFEPGDDLIGFIVTEGREWDGSDEAPLLRSAKLDQDVIETARIVSAYRNEPMMDLLSSILRPILAKMEREEVAKRTQAGEPPKEKRRGKA